RVERELGREDHPCLDQTAFAWVPHGRRAYPLRSIGPGGSGPDGSPTSGFRALPEGKERPGKSFGLDPMRGVEVVALGKRLDREVGKDRREPVGHAGVVIRIAATTDREVHRLVERA